MMASPQRIRLAVPLVSRPPPLEGRRATSQNEILRLARGWCREQGFSAAAARLREVAPDPLPSDCATGLARVLGIRTGASPVATINALIAASPELPTLADRRALREALEEILESLFP